MTSEQTTTETMTSAKCRHVSANVNHCLHKMKLVYFTVLLLLSLPYVAYLGDGAVYLCDNERTTPQEVNMTHAAVMTKGCVLKKSSIKFDLGAMIFQLFYLKSKAPDAYTGDKDALNINISETSFYNSPIILYRVNFRVSIIQNGRTIGPVPLVFTMQDSKMTGTGGLSLCPDEGYPCSIPPRSRIRILRCKFDISINGELFDNNYRGVFTLGTLKLVDSSTIDIADNVIKTSTRGNSKIMAVFYLLAKIELIKGSDFTIRNNKIHMNGRDNMEEMYLWYAAHNGMPNVNISGVGSRMVWKDNCVAVVQRKTSSVKQQMFKGRWRVNKGKLLFDDNKFVTMAEYDLSVGSAITEFLLGTSDNSMHIADDGEVAIRNTDVLCNTLRVIDSVPNHPKSIGITRWKHSEFIYGRDTSVMHGALDSDEDVLLSPFIQWKSYPGLKTIPILTRENLRQYMCKAHSP